MAGLADLVVNLSAGQTASMTVLLELLIDRGVLTPQDVIRRYRQALEELRKSDAGPAGNGVLGQMLQFLETKYQAQGSGGSGDKPH